MLPLRTEPRANQVHNEAKRLKGAVPLKTLEIAITRAAAKTVQSHRACGAKLGRIGHRIYDLPSWGGSFGGKTGNFHEQRIPMFVKEDRLQATFVPEA